MGINLKNADWTTTISENKKHRKKCVCQRTENYGTFCLLHGFEFTGGGYPEKNLRTTPETQSRMQHIRDTRGCAAMGRKFYKGAILTDQPPTKVE